MPIFSGDAGNNNTGAGDRWIGFIAGITANTSSGGPGLIGVPLTSFLANNNTCGATLAAGNVVIPLSGRWELYFKIIGLCSNTISGYAGRMVINGPGNIFCESRASNYIASADFLTFQGAKESVFTIGDTVGLVLNIGSGTMQAVGEAAMFSTYIMGRYVGP